MRFFFVLMFVTSCAHNANDSARLDDGSPAWAHHAPYTAKPLYLQHGGIAKIVAKEQRVAPKMSVPAARRTGGGSLTVAMPASAPLPNRQPTREQGWQTQVTPFVPVVQTAGVVEPSVTTGAEQPSVNEPLQPPTVPGVPTRDQQPVPANNVPGQPGVTKPIEPPTVPGVPTREQQPTTPPVPGTQAPAVP